MWKNFFHVALRNLRKNKVFSLINITGLAIGLASAILIVLFIDGEKSYDKFNEHADSLHRMYVDGIIGEQTFRGSWTSYVMAPTLCADLEDVVNYVRLEVYPQQLIIHDETKVVEDHVMFADSSFFQMFSINLIYGDRDKVLTNPNSVVITTEKARQYFGDDNPIGRTLEFNSKGNYYVVTGVMEEFPENSHFFCDFLLSMSNIPESRGDNWLTNSIYSYLLLADGAEPEVVEKEMNEVMVKHLRTQIWDVFGISFEEWNEAGNHFSIHLQELSDIHLNPDIENGSEVCFRPVNDHKYISVFSLIAFFTLVIASINFMNLTTARSAVRAREIAMRKVVGSQRDVLIKQFLTESVMLSVLALAIALFLVELSLPIFNRAIGLNLDIHNLFHGILFPFIVLLSIVVGLLSGFYPAFYLSKYEPLTGLRGGFINGRKSSMFRSAMVIIQFSISIGIIVGTLIVSMQVDYLIDKNPGFKDDNIVVLDRVYPLDRNLKFFCNELEKIPGVKQASNSSTYLGFSNLSSSYQIKGRDISNNFMFDVNYVQPKFFETYGLQLVDGKGRFFKDMYSADTMCVILNETAVKEYDLKDPLNSVITSPSQDGRVLEYAVIGVVEDFHHSSLTKEITPYMFRYKTKNMDESGYISIRFEEKSIYYGKTLKKIQQLWSKITNDEPFQYFFLDERLDKYYYEEVRTGKITLLFSVLAIFIACLGLFGLTMFNTERRLRELAIRKAMGAGLWSLLLIISKEILLLLGVSIVIAWGLASLVMHRWLLVFPYNIGFTPELYIIAALVAFVVAMLTVNTITLRAARRNPVDSLYHE